MTDSLIEDIEALVRDEPAGSKMELRLWLRLLSCSNLISGEIRRRLRTEFDVTLPRFDVMAQLHREPNGLRLGDLSRRMMVTNGNITGLIDRLVEEGLVLREADPNDRRATTVRLTRAGSTMFRMMASAHESWIHELLAGLSAKRVAELLADLEGLKASVSSVVLPPDEK
ncbi:MAG: MarR family transcriptional regulator [Rhizobiales bacterium 17-65-6]|nr:MAG: MarR family transcriptional regulator [Rhizobiales bacterium 12-68-15]OYX87369.1 MAG: MarR family transcriptional regulator [Azorhizobium sp. 32-67-21]OYZ99845.1 MAG: MarR family transcriptional regulator [Rhizobiales bacterium 17-65-6]